MTIVESAAIFLAITSTWSADWAWGLPLIVLTVVIHVLGVGLIRKRIFQAFSRFTDNRHLRRCLLRSSEARPCGQPFCTD